MRSELLAFVGAQLDAAYTDPASAPLAAAEGFQPAALRTELKIGGVYVRLYIEAAAFRVRDPARFCTALIAHLDAARAPLLGLGPPTADAPADAPTRDRRRADAPAALRALGMLLGSALSSAEPELEEALLAPGALDAILGYLLAEPSQVDEPSRDDLAALALDVACAAARSSRCLGALGASDTTCLLLPLLRSASPELWPAVRRLAVALSTQDAFVARCLDHGGIVHILHRFAASELLSPPPQPPAQATPSVAEPWGEEARAGAGELLCKLAEHPEHGAAVLAAVRSVMPTVFLATLAEDALGTVRVFEASHENPELIWDAGMRAELRAALAHHSDEAYAHQTAAPFEPATALTAEMRVAYPRLTDELCVGGVYLRLLLEQPTWQLRAPRHFLDALLATWTARVAKDVDDPLIAPLSNALLALVQARSRRDRRRDRSRSHRWCATPAFCRAGERAARSGRRIARLRGQTLRRAVDTWRRRRRPRRATPRRPRGRRDEDRARALEV